MIKKHLSTYRRLTTFVVLAALSSIAVAASPGENTANFLKLGIGARGVAMGGAQVALSDDVTSLYWNPANLTSLRTKEISLMHYSLVESVRYQHAGFGLPTEKYGVLAFGINHLDYGDIDGFTNGGVPTGGVDAGAMLFTASWGKRLSDKNKLSYGASLKYLNSELAGFSASAPMLDLGLRYPFESGRLRGLSLAATLRHLGPDVEYDTQKSSLPQQLVLGSGYSTLGGNLNFALDFIRTKDESSYLVTGVEYRLLKMINIRAVYNGNSDFVGEGISYGLGLAFNNWNIDYAFIPTGDLGDSNRVSIGVKFGPTQKMDQAEDQVNNSYKKAYRQYALGQVVSSYGMLVDLLRIAPWHEPSKALKKKIEKQFAQMEKSKDKEQLETDIARNFAKAKAAFDRDELVEAKRGFSTILALKPDSVEAQVYLERINNRYTSLAEDSYRQGMKNFAAGNYQLAKSQFGKTISIDEFPR